MRLDAYVTEKHPSVSRSYVQKQITAGLVLVNGKRAPASHKLRPQDVVEVRFDPAHSEILDITLPIIYEDEDCIVINKPAGVLTHSKGAFNPEATVASFIKPTLTDLDGERAGIVHRLDRATSGVMICAKNPAAQKWLQKQFSQRKVKKTYVALIDGEIEPSHAIIDMPIERNPKKPQTFRVGKGGKAAVTEYEVVKQSSKHSLLILRPTTGRTHQLRVHLVSLGHPIAGDTYYDGPPAPRLFLHAQQLELTLPSRERRIFTVPTPKEFEEYL